jgi:LCP family protein required for cell wall assembly
VGVDTTTEETVSGSEPAAETVEPQRNPSILGKVFRGAGRTALVVLSVSVLAGSGYAWRSSQHLNAGIATTNVFDTSGATPTDDQSGGLTAPTLTTDQNILLVGMDSRTDAHGNPLPASDFTMLNAGPDTGEMNTDTMILVHIPAGGGQAIAISFPRDSYVQIAGGYGKHRLNSAFAYAYNAKAAALRTQGMTDNAQIVVQAKEAGRQNLVATVQNLIGDALTINRYAEVNLYGFYQLSEAVGGVQVCLKAPTYDDQTHASFPAGEQTVSGVQALNFVRERHGLPGGDLDRIVRQQAFLGALAKKILSAGVLTSPSRLDSLISAIQSSVTISSGWDILTFAEEMQGLSSGNVQFVTMPTTGNIVVGGADMLGVSQSEVRQFVGGLMTSGVAATNAAATSSSDAAGSGTAMTPGNSGTTSPGDTTATSDTAGNTNVPTGLDGSPVITADGTPCVN